MAKTTHYSRRSAKLVERDGKATWVPISCTVTRRDEDTGELETEYCPGLTPDSPRAEEMRKQGWTVVDGADGKPSAGHGLVELLLWMAAASAALAVAWTVAWLWEQLL